MPGFDQQNRSPVKHHRVRPNSPKKKISFNQSETEYTAAPNGSLGIMWTTPNARNSTSFDPRRIVSTPEQRLETFKKEHNRTPSERRISSVQKELNSLKPLTPEGKKPVWVPENTEVLSQNLESLLRAASYTPETRRSAMAPMTPNTAQTSTGSPTKKGKKRARPDDDEDDEYKENKRPGSNKRPATRSTTASVRKPVVKSLPKLPLNYVVQVKPKVDLANLAPQPLRISYKPHPLEDCSDAWYTEMFRRLFRQTDKFVTRYFGVHDLDAGKFFEPWGAGMTDEFVTWAEQAAEPDLNTGTGTWDDLLRETRQRKWLVMGVLMRILTVKVFEVDLFGASKEQGELLHGISRALVGREGLYPFLFFVKSNWLSVIGFGRQALRAETARTIMGRNAVTENFYPSVAKLTAQISLLLKPLTDYLYGMQPRLGVPLPKIEDQYQELHNLVSTAAYLSLCTKLSATIFTFNDVSPGTHWDDKDYYNLEADLYFQSRTAVLDDYEHRQKAWNERLQKLNAELDSLKNAGKADTGAGDRVWQELAAHQTAIPSDPGRDYRPMCKIGVWPVITRYKPGGDEDDEKGECSRFVREKDGFRILQLAKGAVVLYYGWNGGKDAHGRWLPNPAGENVELRAWISGKTGERKGLGDTGKVVAGLGAAAVGVMVLGGYGMLTEQFPAMEGMNYVEAARFVACQVFRICLGA